MLQPIRVTDKALERLDERAYPQGVIDTLRALFEDGPSIAVSALAELIILDHEDTVRPILEQMDQIKQAFAEDPEEAAVILIKIAEEAQ